MKVLFVDDMLWGHHVPYLRALADTNNYESVVLISEKISGMLAKQIVYDKLSFDSKKVSDYIECLHFIEKQAQKEKADIIHFVNGDKIMRYFGLGMERLSKRCKVIITFHRFFPGFIRKLSYQLMSRHRVAVVHTDSFFLQMKQFKIQNISHIEYPSFLQSSQGRKMSSVVPVIGMYGGTRFEKGLDILLKALEKVKEPFKLVIAGIEVDFKQQEIEKMCATYGDKVLLDMRFLSESELRDYWNQTDLLVLPYRLSFAGASGQLTEGVNRGLPIIGPEHGSLGDIIRNNHLGEVYKSEDIDDLAETIERVLKHGFFYDEVAKQYQRNLNPKRFCEDYYNLYREMMEEI